MRGRQYKISPVRIPRMPTTITTTTKFVVGVIIILGFRCQYIMESTAASCITTHNPYQNDRSFRLEENGPEENENKEIHTTNKMGIQSQMRDGSIRNCMKRATVVPKHR
jgi:hypothetical protein